MPVSPAQIANATARLNSDLLALSPEFIAIRNAVRTYRTGQDPYLIDLGGTIVTTLSTAASIVTDAQAILYNTPGFLRLAKASGIFGMVVSVAGLFKDASELGNAIYKKTAQPGQFFTVLADCVSVATSFALFGIEIEAAPELIVLYGGANFLGSVVGSLAGQMESVHNVFVHCDPAGFSALGSYSYISSDSVSSTRVEGPISVTGPNLPARFSGMASDPSAGFEGTPEGGAVDTFVGNATFIGESGSDTFMMNGQMIARGTTGSGGGMGNTYIIATNGVATGDGTIEGQGSGNVVMVAGQSGNQQLTTLMIQQYEDQSAADFYTQVPIAAGYTNTGQGFLLIQDDPDTAAQYNMADNPHNKENVDFELYLFSPGGGATFNHERDSFGLDPNPTDDDISGDADLGLQYQQYMEVLSSGATATGVTIDSGAVLEMAIVVTGAMTASGVVGATTSVSGVTVLSGGVIDYEGLTVSSGGALTVLSGAVVSVGAVAAGGTLAGAGAIVGSSVVAGAISGVTLSGSSGAPGSLMIQSGGLASGVTIASGTITVGAGATASGTILAGPGAAGIVSGVAVGTVVGSRATDTDRRGGSAKRPASIRRLPAPGNGGARGRALKRQHGFHDGAARIVDRPNVTSEEVGNALRPGSANHRLRNLHAWRYRFNPRDPPSGPAVQPIRTPLERAIFTLTRSPGRPSRSHHPGKSRLWTSDRTSHKILAG